MTNTQIIINEAVANGLYTKEEVENILAGGHMIPLHTFQTWKNTGYSVKKGNTQESLPGFGNSQTRQRKLMKRTKIRTVQKITIII